MISVSFYFHYIRLTVKLNESPTYSVTLKSWSTRMLQRRLRPPHGSSSFQYNLYATHFPEVFPRAIISNCVPLFHSELFFSLPKDVELSPLKAS